MAGLKPRRRLLRKLASPRITFTRNKNMNIVEIIMKLVGSGDGLSKIASLLGIGEAQAGKAVGAAVPSLLAGLLGSASKPEGAAQLSSLLAKQDPSLLDNLSGLLSHGSGGAESTSNPLTSLLGGGGLGQIAGVLSKFTGVGDGIMGKLLGMLGPVLLGILSKQSKGLDAAGLASMLAGQKQNVAAAMPAGLGNLLSSAVPGLGSLLDGAPRAVANAAGSAASSAARTASSAAHQVEAAGSPLKKWLLPLIAAILAGIFLPKMCSKAPQAVTDVRNSAAEAVSAASDHTQILGQISGLIKDAGETASSIKDEATAEAALPKLQGINTKLAGLKPLWEKLPVSARNLAAASLRPMLDKFRTALQPVLSLPLVGAKLQPVVGEMLASLEGFLAAAP